MQIDTFKLNLSDNFLIIIWDKFFFKSIDLKENLKWENFIIFFDKSETKY